MPLELRYRVNEGINVTEDLGNGYQKSVEVIVRNIDLFPEGVKVDFDLLGLNGCSKLSLREGERYDITPLCTLHLPRDPLRGRSLSRNTLRRSLPRYPLMRKSLPREDSVFLKFYAPKEVEFGKRKMYQPLNL
jgi:hypothetical protein